MPEVEGREPSIGRIAKTTLIGGETGEAPSAGKKSCDIFHRRWRSKNFRKLLHNNALRHKSSAAARLVPLDRWVEFGLALDVLNICTV
jgi:hypothetical protein